MGIDDTIECADILQDSPSSGNLDINLGEGNGVTVTEEDDRVCVMRPIYRDPDSPTSTVLRYETTYFDSDYRSLLSPRGGCGTMSVYASLKLHFPSALSGNIEEDMQDISDAINANPATATEVESIMEGYVELLGEDNVEVNGMEFDGSEDAITNMELKLQDGCDVSVVWFYLTDEGLRGHIETVAAANGDSTSPNYGFQTIGAVGAQDNTGIGGVRSTALLGDITPSNAHMICVCPA